MAVLVTGGAGFIGTNFVLDWLHSCDESVVSLDKLTYAGNLQNLASVENNSRHSFVQGDIGDRTLVSTLLKKHEPRAIINFAADSHVDRSIQSAEEFIQTNVVSTFRFLDVALDYWRGLLTESRTKFRFLHVSTDEVYGTLEPDGQAFTETSRYAPNNPYSASKAASDHLIRAFHRTYGLPVLTTNCSNNYGPFQFPEKLIPLVIQNALAEEALPIYGDGQQIRDWLYVRDHCDAIKRVLDGGKVGEVYNVGGEKGRTNLEVVTALCEILDEMHTRANGHSYRDLIKFVRDRPGHDRRYAINASKIERNLGWKPRESFETGLRKTVVWYLKNQDWVADVVSGDYRDWIDRQYK